MAFGMKNSSVMVNKAIYRRRLSFSIARAVNIYICYAVQN
jgi:hypothetical protein